MQSPSCLICKKSHRQLISIDFKINGNSVKDDILELCGNSVEQYLEANDLVCSKCIKVLDNAAKLRRQVYEIILDHATNGRKGSKALNLSKVWDVEVSNTPQHLSYGTTDVTYRTLISPDNLPSSPCSLSHVAEPSPSLLTPVRSIPYEERPDTDIEEANNKYRYGNTPDLDLEVQKTNSKRRRRKVKGHNWSRKKRSQQSRSLQSRASVSHYSQSQSQSSELSKSTPTSSPSRSSRGTVVTKKQQMQKQLAKVQLERILSDFQNQDTSLNDFSTAFIHKYLKQDVGSIDVGAVPNKTRTSVVTRFASEIRQQMLAEYKQLLYVCPVKACSKVFEDLDELTYHRFDSHDQAPYYICNHCNLKYHSQEYLDKHEADMHYQQFVAFCMYCSEEFNKKALYEDHLNEHLLHSFPCSYCDKFFLRKQLCDNHIRLEHAGKKHKIKRMKRHSILDRIDKEQSEMVADSCSPTTSTNSVPFVVKVLLSPRQQVSNNVENSDNINVTESISDENVPTISKN